MFYFVKILIREFNFRINFYRILIGTGKIARRTECKILEVVAIRPSVVWFSVAVQRKNATNHYKQLTGLYSHPRNPKRKSKHRPIWSSGVPSSSKLDDPCFSICEIFGRTAKFNWQWGIPAWLRGRKHFLAQFLNCVKHRLYHLDT